MAVRENVKFVILKIQPSWFDFRIVLEDKCACLYGKDKNEPLQGWGTDPDNPYYDEQVLMGCAFEQSRSDHSLPDILGEGVDDEGKRYLIIDRREKYK